MRRSNPTRQAVALARNFRSAIEWERQAREIATLCARRHLAPMAAYWADSADKWRRSAEHHLDAIRCHLGCHVTRSQVLRLARTRSRFVQRVTVRRLKASTPYSKHLHRPVEREVPVISPVPRSRALVVVKRGGSR